MDEQTRRRWESLRAMLCDERYALGVRVVEDSTLTPDQRAVLALEFRKKTQEIVRISRQLVGVGPPEKGEGGNPPGEKP